MAVVQGIREKVHHPIYDCLTIEKEKQLRDEESSSTIRFFVNVQGKTKLQTNLQSASLLPHYNTFEARAMRVVLSDLPPVFPEDPTIEMDTAEDGLQVTNEDGQLIDLNGGVQGSAALPLFDPSQVPTVELEIGLDRAMDLLKEANENDGEVELSPDDEDVSILVPSSGNEASDPQIANLLNAGGTIFISAGDLEALIEDLGQKSPPREQLRPGNGAGNIISKLIYNTVTTFYVGEKIMIQMPTWFFPGGAGPYSQTEKGTTHGEPSPAATFRFAEPIFIDRQQNFRVEIEVPDADVLKEIQKIYGPLFVWVVLDGYMTRGVQ